MACRYEEEIYAATGKMDKCGCPTCPYKKIGECYEVRAADQPEIKTIRVAADSKV
jgi:hypothetical protein